MYSNWIMSKLPSIRMSLFYFTNGNIVCESRSVCEPSKKRLCVCQLCNLATITQIILPTASNSVKSTRSRPRLSLGSLFYLLRHLGHFSAIAHPPHWTCMHTPKYNFFRSIINLTVMTVTSHCGVSLAFNVGTDLGDFRLGATKTPSSRYTIAGAPQNLPPGTRTFVVRAPIRAHLTFVSINSSTRYTNRTVNFLFWTYATTTNTKSEPHRPQRWIDVAIERNSRRWWLFFMLSLLFGSYGKRSTES